MLQKATRFFERNENISVHYSSHKSYYQTTWTAVVQVHQKESFVLPTFGMKIIKPVQSLAAAVLVTKIIAVITATNRRSKRLVILLTIVNTVNLWAIAIAISHTIKTRLIHNINLNYCSIFNLCSAKRNPYAYSPLVKSL